MSVLQGSLRFLCGDLESLHTGHILLAWFDGDVTFSVSFHGHSPRCRFSGSGTSYIDPGPPWQNPWVES
ncbi:MAG TPA: hypothetical protein VGW38_04995 [Chloroflexota bacterium]|nr:hypothetical protein [Chloroflexota bacterium]